MKKYFLLSLIGLTLLHISAIAQQSDTTVQITVQGNCDQCKDRIESAAKLNGVTNAVWDEETKKLSLTYNPVLVTLERIEKKIVSVGHDVEQLKADEKVYKKLPACCKYRKVENASNINPPTSINFIKGVVFEEKNNGTFFPLYQASVHWLEGTVGALTDSNGVFNIPFNGKHLVVSYSGYKPDTVFVNDAAELKIILASGMQLAEVKVTSVKRSLYTSALDPIKTQVMSERELFKAACCNLSESFETNPSVDVSYNDAVTGSKQIQLLGLSGIYTQLTVENLPGPRGIATPLGLNSIAGPWIESIQLVKGIGSVANGFESVAGQINLELKKPDSKEKLLVNAYLNDFGKTDVNLVFNNHINNNWSTATLLHYDFLKNKNLDENEDGFKDQPTGNQFSMLHRWQYQNTKGWEWQFGYKGLFENRIGGQTNFNEATDKFTDHHYGVGININRNELFSKLGYVFPQKKYKSIGLQLAASQHRHRSYFGFNTYDADQTGYYANLIYQSIIGNTKHKFRVGASVMSDKYEESVNAALYKRHEIVSGSFAEYTFIPNHKFSAVLGMRGDYSNLYGWFATPRAHIKYELFEGNTIRLSAGRGQRTANIFAENTNAFVSSRQLQILSTNTYGAYGLRPEVAWNKGISVDQNFKLFRKQMVLNLDYFRTDFTHQVVVDYEDVNKVSFYNLDGQSYSNSFQAEMYFYPVKFLEWRLAYRFLDVKTTYDGELKSKPLISSHRWFTNFGYDNHHWRFDATLSFNGSKRIPDTKQNPVMHRMPEYSPQYYLLNAQITKIIGKKNPIEVYVGGENLTNYFQKGVILSAEEPFGEHFDASMVWGPATGRMLYVGMRYKLK